MRWGAFISFGYLSLRAMMRKLSTWLLALLAATAISACCGSVSCECDDTLEDAVYFQFNLADSLGSTGFRPADIDTVLVVRYPFVDTLVQSPNTPKTPNDTARIIRSRALVSTPIVLNNTAPFTAGGGRKLDAYKYQVFVVRHFPVGTVPRRDTIFYALDQFRLQGRFIGDGCCTCYQNEGKQLRVSRGKKPSTTGTVLDVTTAEGAEPKPVVLSR
jgi:hypothetical protein